MTLQTDLSLTSRLNNILPLFERASRNVPVAIDVFFPQSLSVMAGDIGRLEDVENIRVAQGQVLAEMPARLVRYMGGDPRVSRICLK